MAEQIARLHRQEGGATFNRYFGDMSGQPLFAVSVFPDETAIEPGLIIGAFVLRGFIQKKAVLLRDPRNNVGTWYNSDEDETYLDVSTTLPDREDAFALAGEFNQIAIYDLANNGEIATFGTGEDNWDLPPAGERLPPLREVRRSDSDGKDNTPHHPNNRFGNHEK